ncbi:DUF945 family protein [Nitratifractor sp.]
MKKRLVTILVLLVVLCGGARYYVSHHAKERFMRFLDAENRQQQLFDFNLSAFEGGWFRGAARVLAHPRKSLDGFVDPIELNETLSFGPVIFPDLRLGWMGMRYTIGLDALLSAEGKDSEFYRSLQKPVTIAYRGRIDFSDRVWEDTRVAPIVSVSKDKSRLEVGPIHVRDRYKMADLTGVWHAEAPRIYMDTHGERNDSLEITQPNLDAAIEEFVGDRIVFGSYRAGASRITIRLPELAGKGPLRTAGSLGLGLHRQSDSEASFAFDLEARALDDATVAAAKGVRRNTLKLRMEHLGIAGLEVLVQMQKRREELTRKMAEAMDRHDDIALQKAILGLQALEGDWLKVYNRLLIPGKTTLHLENDLESGRTNRLVLDLTYTGTPLKGDPMSALIALGAHADRLVEGSFSLTLEKSLAEKLYPNAVLILNSMAAKNLAKLENGVYRLKGEIKGGKIVINGTAYAPQELIMMILM